MVTIEIDDSSAKAKALLTLLKDMPFVKIKEDQKSLKGLTNIKKRKEDIYLEKFRVSLKDMKEGRVKPIDELFNDND